MTQHGFVRGAGCPRIGWSRSIRNQTAVVGVGRTPYYRRGQSLPQTKIELACKAIIDACDDAGLAVTDVDGFAYYSGGFDTALIAQTLGIPEVKFTATLTGGGGGAAASVGLAANAIYAPEAPFRPPGRPSPPGADVPAPGNGAHPPLRHPP